VITVILRRLGLVLIGESVIVRKLDHIHEELKVTQAKIDAYAEQVEAYAEQNAAATAAVRADIAELKNQPGAEVLDFTNLDASMSNLGASVSGLQALDQENPAPPADLPTDPAPEPEPTV
jgi:monomeric isocitrate dehydrogenase